MVVSGDVVTDIDLRDRTVRVLGKGPGAAVLALDMGKGWLAALTLRHLSSQFEDDLQSDRLPAQTTLDAASCVCCSCSRC